MELILTLAYSSCRRQRIRKEVDRQIRKPAGHFESPLEELASISGIRIVTPVALQIIKAAATPYLQQSCEGLDVLADPTRLSEFWRIRIGSLKNEAFEVAYPSSGYRLLRDGAERLEEGTTDRATVYPQK